MKVFGYHLDFQPRDRAAKHALVREVADYVLLHRAELVMCISEAWIAATDPNKPGVHAVDYPNRREGITVDCLSRTGEMVSLGCEFTRTSSGIEFGEVQNWGKLTNNWLEPIRRAFSKL